MNTDPRISCRRNSAYVDSTLWPSALRSSVAEGGSTCGQPSIGGYKPRLRFACFVAVAALALLVFGAGRVQAATTYYSQGSLTPSTVANWNTVRTGGGSSPANFTSGDTFVIQNGHNMGTTATLSISGTGSKLWIENGGTLTANNAVTLAAATTFQIDGGGTYVHNNTSAYGSTIFQAGTKAFATSSTVILNNSNTTGPSSVTFGNLTVNFTSDPGGSVNCSGGLTTINGNFTVTSTSTREFRVAASSTQTLTIGGDLIVNGGTLNLASSTGVTTVNVSGNVSVTSGTLTVNTAGNGKINFAKAGTQTYASGGTVSKITWTVNNGSTVDTGTSVFSGTSVAFTLSSGGGLMTASASGINGNFSGITPTLNTGANYAFYGSASSAVTGALLPTTVNNLTINNANGVNLSGNVTVNGTLTLASGKLTPSSFTLALGSAASVSGGSSSSYVDGTLIKTFGAGTGQTFTAPIGAGSAYRPVALSALDVGTGGTLTMSTTTGDHSSIATSGIDPSKDANCYWTATTSGGFVLGAGGYNIDLTWASGDLDGSATATSFVMKKLTSGTWSDPTSVTASATHTLGTGLSAFSDYVVGEVAAGATIPSLTSPTKSAVADTTATLGATVTSDGGASLTSRGTVWDTTPTPTANALAEGGTSVDTFTQGRTGLPAGTLIYYRGYAINSAGTGYTAGDSFYTLSTEPSTHVGGPFAAAAASGTSITLNWTPATGAGGYLILQRLGASAPTGAPIDATTYTVGNAVGDGTVAAIVTPGTAIAATIAGLTGNQQYSFVIFPFASDGSHAATYNYRAVPAAPTASATTLSASSDIIRASGFTEPSNIDYASYQTASGLTTGNSTEMARFTIRDGGASLPDADSAATTLSAITFTVQNGGNLRRVALFDGSGLIAEAAGGTSVTFSGLTGLSADDDGSKDFSVRATFNSTVTDNQQIKFTVNSAMASAGGSAFAATDAGGAASDVTADANRIEVAATKLVFSMAPPSAVVPGANFGFTVQAQDANSNVDLDSTASVTISKYSGSGTLSSATGLTQNLASGAKTWTDVQIDISSTFTIQAASDSLTPTVSGTITAASLLLTENFDYTAADLITAHGWTAHSGSGAFPITVTSPGLTYAGYASSGVGNAVSMTTSGEDDNKTFTATSSGSVYAAFLVRPSAANTGGDYFLHFMQGSSFYGRVWLKRDASSNLAFGLSKFNTTPAYTGFSYSLNTTYLVVLKYTFNTGTTTDDTVSLFIDPVPGGSEPAATISFTEGTADPTTGLTAIALRQGTAGSMPTVVVDGIRVATAWADAVACTAPTAYSVTGGGAYCSGGAGVAIGLANSESGVNYQLYRNNGGSPVTVGTPVSGTTGSAIEFGTQQYVADSYTVAATRASGVCSADMTGNAVVIVNPAASTSAITGSSLVASGQADVIYSVTATSGSSYAWTIPSGASITSGSGTASITVNWGTAASGSVAVTETTSLGCVGAPVSLLVTVNHAPTAQNFSLNAPSGTGIRTVIIGGKNPPSDLDSGDTLTVTAVSSPTAHGATVTTDGIAVIYTALSTFTGADSFTYTVSDGQGGTAVGTVSVTVVSSSGLSPNVVSGPTFSGGAFHVTFAGIPDFQYTVQYASDPNGPWDFLKTATSDSHGYFEVTDAPDPKPEARYYRTVYP